MDDRTIAQQFRHHHVMSYLSSGLSQRAYCSRPLAPSRATLGKWLRRYRKAGIEGLVSGTPSRCPWNRTGLEDEAKILAYVLVHPGHGPQTIANELRGSISVGHNGVHGVLKRRGIHRYRARLEWVRQELGEVVTKTELERARDRARSRHLEVSYPGELWGQDTFLIGRLKGVGAIYHYLAVDIASSFAVAKLYPERTAEAACDFLENHLAPKAKNLGIHRLLQDNGTEYTAARWRDPSGSCNHPFHELAGRLGIELTFTQPRHAWTNGSCERLHQTLLRDFYQPALCSRLYETLEDLDYDLQLFLQHYNYRRTHQGFRLRGDTPASVYLSGRTPTQLRLRIAA